MTDNEKAISAIKKGKLGSIYLIVGDGYACDQVLRTIQEVHAGGDGTGSVAPMERFRAGEHAVDLVLASALTMPMFAERRLIVVRHCDEWKADSLNALIPYVEKPVPTTTLVLIARKIDARVKAIAAIKKQGGLIRFEELRDRHASQWILQEAQRQGVRLDAGAAKQIADSIGTNRGELASALERVADYAGGNRVSLRDVEDVLSETRQRSVFDLTNAVGRADQKTAIYVLRRMREAREPGLKIIAMIARHLRQLWSVKELSEEGGSDSSIARALGIPPFFVPDLVKQAKNFSEQKFRQMHRLLCDADQMMKTTRVNEDAILSQLVFEFCAK